MYFKNAEQLRTYIEKLKADYENRTSAIREQIKALREQPHSEGKIAQLEEQLEMLKNAHAKAMERNEAKLKPLEIEEAKQSAEAAKRREAQAKEVEKRMKAKALIEFRKTGGTDEEFEQQWPAIREKIRNEIVVSKMVVTTEPSKPAKL